MKSHFYLIFLAVTICFSSFSFAYAVSSNDLSKKKIEIENILKLSLRFGKDTAAAKSYLANTLLKAKKENDIPILWVYNLLMADINSILFDTTNPISDEHYNKAQELLKQGDFPELEFIGHARQGYYHFIYRKISEAFPFFLHANFLEAKIDKKKTPDLLAHYRFIASFYSYIGNEERAIDYLEIALPFSEKASRVRIDLLNALGIYNKRMANEKKAIDYLKQSLNEAILAKDSVWIGILYGNLSDFTWKEGKAEETLNYLKQNITLSMRYNEPIDAMRANLKIATHYLSLNELRKSSQHVQNAINLMEEKPYYLSFRVDALKCLAEIANRKADYLEERNYLKQYLILKEQLDEQVNSEEIKKISWKFEVEKYEQTLLNNQVQQNYLQKKYILIAVSIVLVALIIILLINRSRVRIKIKNIELEKNKLIFDLEKQNLNQELIIAKSALTEFTETINKNNTTIQKLRKELESTTIIDEQIKTKVSNELDNMLKSHLMTNERWIDFKKEFDILHPNYLSTLKANHALLTENDLRIIALVKLKLNNKAMGDLLGISVEGIKKAKQRLKKKLTFELEFKE